VREKGRRRTKRKVVDREAKKGEGGKREKRKRRSSQRHKGEKRFEPTTRMWTVARRIS
jgi:hypothetical protein